MPPFKSAYLEHELKRWMRPDAHHFVRPDWRRHVTPGSDLAAVFALYENKYSPDQPRDDQGRWTSGGGGAEGKPSSSTTEAEPVAENSRISAQVAADCDTMHRKDLFVCRAVRLRACYEQAYLRLTNCQAGRPYPPLNF